MAGSQLKRLKSSLRDQGIIGPQKSKKQKKKAAEEARAKGGEDKRLRKSVALESIREQFNPFQFKMNARGPKFPVTSLRSQKEGLRGIKGRPAQALSRSEEKRRATLLIDMQRRNKVGGILDRRLGEADPNMTPEERALERFAFEKQRMHSKKGASVFDLEDDGDGFVGLTHMGQSLAVDEEGEEAGGVGAGERDKTLQDDFDDDDIDDDDDGDDDGRPSLKTLKRMRSDLLQSEAAGADGEPDRKKTKKEIMEEVIAKSKLHKYERQAVKEADEDERAALDKMLPELQELLFSQQAPSRKPAAAAPETATATATATAANKAAASRLADKVDKAALDKAYDLRLRQMMQDKKAEPSARTKTEEEVATEQSAHLKKLEESRLKRMMGEIEPEEAQGADKGGDEDLPLSFPAQEEDDEFQLGQGIRVRHTAAELGFDDEDDFLIDDDLVASGSEAEDDDEDDDDDSEDSEDGEGSEEDQGEDEEDEFTRGLLTEEEKSHPAFAGGGSDDDGIPYTFPCPQSHAELLAVVQGLPTAKLPTVVQRIRALHHPKLEQGNKERLGRFAAALVDHVAYLGDRAATRTKAGDDASDAVSYATIESLVRHIHSLAKMAPIDVAVAFRIRLAGMAAGEKGAGGVRRLGGGDLVVLSAVATLFPTSDHFHQVVTPAMLVMARFLEHRIPRTLADYAASLYVCTLFLQYQRLSRRYVPELVQAAVNTVLALAPTRLPAAQHAHLARLLPVHAHVHDQHARAIRLSDKKAAVRPLRPSECFADPNQDGRQDQSLRASLLATAVAVLAAAATLWEGHASLEETLEPMAVVLGHLLHPTHAQEPEKRGGKAAASSLPEALRQRATEALATVQAAIDAARQTRRPLELHHHRPLAIRTFVPRFEDDYDPDKHYDPNQERSETKKLQAEYKRERKGALRELRKDAAFMAREKLKIKKAKDAAYEKKYRRLVAEIQGEEGRAANEYERERQGRKNKR